MNSVLTKKQTKTIDKQVNDGSEVKRIIVKIRYDDECGNGHNSFAITGTTYDHAAMTSDRRTISGGCIHDDIVKYCPELAHLIKWHLTSSDGPMHYVANTLYHARDTDYDGLKKGEYGSHTIEVMINSDKGGGLRSVYCSGTIYVNHQNNHNLEKSNIKEHAELDRVIDSIKPELNPIEVKTPCSYSKSEGNPSNLEAAQSCAIWPNATLEQLQDEEQLKARLPALMTEFKQVIESLDFIY